MAGTVKSSADQVAQSRHTSVVVTDTAMKWSLRRLLPTLDELVYLCISTGDGLVGRGGGKGRGEEEGAREGRGEEGRRVSGREGERRGEEGRGGERRGEEGRGGERRGEEGRGGERRGGKGRGGGDTCTLLCLVHGTVPHHTHFPTPMVSSNSHRLFIVVSFGLRKHMCVQFFYNSKSP